VPFTLIIASTYNYRPPARVHRALWNVSLGDQYPKPGARVLAITAASQNLSAKVIETGQRAKKLKICLLVYCKATNQVRVVNNHI